MTLMEFLKWQYEKKRSGLESGIDHHSDLHAAFHAGAQAVLRWQTLRASNNPPVRLAFRTDAELDTSRDVFTPSAPITRDCDVSADVRGGGVDGLVVRTRDFHDECTAMLTSASRAQIERECIERAADFLSGEGTIENS